MDDCDAVARELGYSVKDGCYPSDCCDSCHEDADRGYADLAELPDGRTVCCAWLRRMDPERFGLK